MSTPEGEVLRACLYYLKLMGFAAWRINTMGTPLHDGSGRWRKAPARGISDIIAVYEGEAIAVEVKSEKGRQSPAQSAFQAEWENAGGLYLLVRSASELKDKLFESGVLTKA